MIKIILPQFEDSLNLSKPIVRWFDSIRNLIYHETNQKVDYKIYGVKKLYINSNDFDEIYQRISSNDLVLIHPEILSKNLYDFQKYQGTIVCILPYKKPVQEETSRKYPIDEKDAINNNFRIIYLDETPPKDMTHILVISPEMFTITKEQFIETIKNNHLYEQTN